MCSREFSTASCWYRLISAGSVSLNTPPTGLRASRGVLLHLAVREQRQLVELLLERHPPQERVDAALGGAVEALRHGLQRSAVPRAFGGQRRQRGYQARHQQRGDRGVQRKPSTSMTRPPSMTRPEAATGVSPGPGRGKRGRLAGHLGAPAPRTAKAAGVVGAEPPAAPWLYPREPETTRLQGTAQAGAGAGTPRATSRGASRRPRPGRAPGPRGPRARCSRPPGAAPRWGPGEGVNAGAPARAAVRRTFGAARRGAAARVAAADLGPGGGRARLLMPRSEMAAAIVVPGANGALG